MSAFGVSELLRLAAVMALVATNGFFVAVEFAVVSARRTRLSQLIEQGNTLARLAQYMVEHTDRILAACQLGITMASLALGWIGEASVAELVKPPLERLAVGMPGFITLGTAHFIAVVISFSIITALHIVLGEQAPKTFAIRYPETVAMWSARPILWFNGLFRPFIWFLDRASAGVLRLLGVEPIPVHGTVYSVEELKLLVADSQRGGVLEPEEREMVSRALEFAERQAREAMIPRTDVVGVEADATIADLLQVYRQASHARFPVYEGDLDNIVGIVAIKDVLRALAEDRNAFDRRVVELAREPYFVPETKLVGDLFAEMRHQHIQMAIIVDEYGGTAGIVTAEELVEEIVGRLSDELVPPETAIKALGERKVQIDAQLRVDEVNEELGLKLPEGDDYETVAGLILHQLRRIPDEGEGLRVDGVQLTIAEMKGPKIEKVIIQW